MTIGRTDDPENPLRATAFKAASLFGTGSRTPSGPAVMAPRQQAGHMIAIDPPVRLLIFSLASKGPSTHGTEGYEAIAPTSASLPPAALAPRALTPSVRFSHYGFAGSGGLGRAAGNGSSVNQFVFACANRVSNSDVHLSKADLEQSRYSRPPAMCQISGRPALLRPSDTA